MEEKERDETSPGSFLREWRTVTTADLIYQKVKHLPEGKQAEILDFVEFLNCRSALGGEDESKKWTLFSLAAAMRGMESEDMPQYSLDDLRERYA
jgi:hypothetical protein